MINPKDVDVEIVTDEMDPEMLAELMNGREEDEQNENK